jgi:hypothetical protein
VSVVGGPDDSLPLFSSSFSFLGDGILHLFVFEQDELVLSVAVAVVLDKEVEGLFVSSFTHEESRSLGNELDGN